MAEVIRMPRMSDTMEEGNIVDWLVAEGDSVEPGQTLAEVETDKATMELDSYFEGVLLHIAVKEGAVPIDGVIAVIGEEGEDWKAAIAAAGDGAAAAPAEAPAAKEEAPAPAPAPAAAPAPAPAAPAVASDDRIKASPLAKAMAKEAGIDLSTVTGSGENGRIVKADVEQAKAAPAAKPAPAPAAAPAAAAPAAAPAPNVPVFAFNAGGDNFEEAPVSQMRKVIARRLGESKFTAPHFYVTVEIAMDKVWEFRKKLNEVAPVKISFNDLVVKACAINLPKHPVINSSWMGDKIRTNHDVNIGVAVAIPDGLLVPVVRYANMKSLSQINMEVKELAGRAKNKKLSPDEMSGNTFTISNLGMFGVEEFTAIINPPDAAIMAIGGIQDKAVVRDGAVVPGKVMKVTLSSDHRVVDGASAAAFLNDVKACLEDPIRLMV
ncbi:pyruvate dehydrogenase complex dihydrolipoamide acetyltransferase [Neolewinella agarilytica]|uniref:Acetyltransferase component of pyruvate dehydrogenase complex n=1 Tax=Neolewinella agarilytica TaxID=478744 RepID=A0A1H9M7E6_9BACT|nr:pyruvate dehydrogenase complex dihydrolipoamide acetyltransferase [Neolewinella agarilytica]SER19608.1 pyruvate dehydrogenase E2 component (dihydrolipoamide acetyltransferase) [Neolewinella agarilytica]